MTGHYYKRAVLLPRFWVVLVAFIVIAVTLATGFPTQEVPADDDDAFEAPKSGKLFNFSYYKQVFGKHYKSYLEELSRKRLFLSRALSAFVSKIEYKYKLTPFYLGVNDFSDMTPEELASMENKYAGHSGTDTPTSEQTHASPDNSDLLLQPELIPGENENVEEELESLAREHGDNEPGYKELREVLASEPLGRGRKKRAIDQLVPALRSGEPKLANKQQQYGLRVQQENLKWHKSKTEVALIKDALVGVFSFIGDSIRKKGSLNGVDETKLPDEVFFDHRRSGCMLPPRNQGKCGSCYAFAAITFAEWLYCQKTGKLVAFSEQYMVDCGRTLKGRNLLEFGIITMNGCDGATNDSVPKFIHNFGLELNANYHYLAKAGKCPYRQDFDLKKTGHVRMELTNVFEVSRDQFGDYLEHSPIYISIKTDPTFQAYKAGVDNGLRCQLMKQTNHAMLLVGHGRENNTDYWLIRNSYGRSWGMGGYYKLAKSATARCIDLFGLIFGTEDGQNFSFEPKLTNHV